MSSPAARRRDRFGKHFYPVPHPETRELHDLPSWSRLKNLLYSGGLETWKLKSVARTVARRSDLQMLAADDDTTYSAVRQALDANQNKANVGTAVHKYTEYIDAGGLDRETVPPVMEPWLANYEACKAKYGWTMVETEATVYNLTAGYAGTADRFVHLPGYGVVGLDLKTGAEVWAETALQLAAYSGAEGLWTPPMDNQLPEFAEQLARLERDIAAGENFKGWGSPKARKWSEAAKKVAYASLDELYWDEFAKWPGHRPMPEGLRTDIAFVVHLTGETCELVPMVLDGEPSAHEVVRSLCCIFNWQQREKAIVGQPLSMNEEGETDADTGDSDGGSDPAVGAYDSPAEERDPAPAPDQPPAEQPASKDGDGKSVKPRFQELEPTANWLIQRIMEMPEECRAELATAWPEGVPTFKQSREQNVGQLWAIHDAISAIEREHELPFVDRTTPLFTQPPTLVNEAYRASLIERVSKLAPEVLELIQAKKNEEGIPNLRSPRMTSAQAARLASIISEVAQSYNPNNTGEKQAA